MLLHETNNIFVAKTCLSTFFVRYLIEYFPFDRDLVLDQMLVPTI